MDLFQLVRASASAPLHVVETGVKTASAVTAMGVDLATKPLRAAAGLPGGQVAEAIADVASEFLGGGRSRRCWAGQNSCWIEVRGLTESDDRLGELVVHSLQAQPDVEWAKLNYP
ncbi:MAG TPA: hypothetical protein VKA77_06310, partial [Mycobacterium sp.]|nr:hypothetical protein [Mycobacterium sp.]